eukprot:gene17991-biopygen10247
MKTVSSLLVGPSDLGQEVSQSSAPRLASGTVLDSSVELATCRIVQRFWLVGPGLWSRSLIEYPSPAPDGITIAVADRPNHRIRLVVAATGAVTTLAGNGASTYADGVGTAAAFNGPTGVAYAPDGATLAIADRSNHRVRLVSVATGVVTTLAGSGAASFADGLAAAASFDRPLSVAYAPTGDEIAVADRSNHRVRAVSTCSPAGTEPPTVAPTSSVVGLFSEKPTSVPRAFHVDPALSY